MDIADTAGLRQGDILRDIPFPGIRFQEIAVLSSVPSSGRASEPLMHQHNQDRDWNTAQLPMRLCHCAVLTQCCDLDLRDRKVPKAHAIALARLLRPPKLAPENLASLRANRDPRSGEPGYITYFYLEEHVSLDQQPWVVDFNQVFSIPSTEFPELVKRKILQMDGRSRVKFKIKLATFFGRITDEEEMAGIRDPWSVPPSTEPESSNAKP